MKKVLFLIGTLGGGGAEKVLIDTVNALDMEKYQITVQTLFDDKINRDQLSGKIRYKTIISCSQGICRRIIAKLLFSVMGSRKVYQWFVNDDYDYEIAFLEGMPTKIISDSTNQKACKIAWIHTDLQGYPDSCHAFGSEDGEAKAYNRFDRIFCVSEAVKQAFHRKYPFVKTQTGVLYNILDEQAITAASRETVTLPTNIVPCFLSVGALENRKGYDRLLRIHNRLIKEGFIHSLIIVGEGSLHKELERYILENQLSNTVFLVGFQKNPYPFMKQADCFISASYVEGFSTVVSESLLCGTPVIATNVAGNNEPTEMPRCSAVVENDENALYEVIRSVLQEPGKLASYQEELPARQNYFKREKLISMFEKNVFYN